MGILRISARIMGKIISKTLNVSLGSASISRWIEFSTNVAERAKLDHSKSERLLDLPKNLQGWVKLSITGNHFLYFVSEIDDLRFAARRNLEDWEKESREMFANLCTHSTNIVDVGAYTGVYSLIAAASNPGAKVFAFEPNPYQYEFLEKNIAQNNFMSQIQTFNFALSDSKGHANLYSGSHRSTFGTSIATLSPQGHLISSTSIAKPDDVLSNHSVELMKIDVEGSELDVLKGATQILQLTNPTLLIEALTPGKLLDIIEFLSSFGYGLPRELDSRNFLFIGEAHKAIIQEL